jgi:cytoskeleton protein RodZ
METGIQENNENKIIVNIGKELQRKRNELNFDERQVATQLKIPIEQVRALEANEFDYFRSATFARGYLRNYVRLIKLDEGRILGAFDGALEDDEPSVQPINKNGKQAQMADPIVILVSVIIVAMVIFLGFWWPTMMQESPIISTETTTEQQETVSSDDALPILVEEDAETAIEVTDTPTAKPVNDVEIKTDVKKQNPDDQVAPKVSIETPAKQNEVTTTDDADVVTGLSAETIAILKDAGVNPDTISLPADEPSLAEKAAIAASLPPLYDDEVVINFSSDCWTEVRDGNGRILYSGVKKADTSLTLTADGPYKVVFGFAGGVSSLIYKGEEFDFTSFTRKNLARFELN